MVFLVLLFCRGGRGWGDDDIIVAPFLAFLARVRFLL